MTDPRTQPDWRALLVAWDRQQSGYLPNREQRFDAMLEALRALVGEQPLVLDFACGPGSISQRLLERLPLARSVAIDLDPVLLTVGEGALGSIDGRLRWVQGDLSSEDWAELVGSEPFDAVLSTTAVHWLTSAELAHAYGQMARIVRPGGIVLVGDNMPFDREKAALRRLVSTLERQRHHRAFAIDGIEDWERWWRAAAAEPVLADLVAERDRLFAEQMPGPRDPDEPTLLGGAGATFSEHTGALTAAGFVEVDVIWQDLDDRVLAAIR